MVEKNREVIPFSSKNKENEYLTDNTRGILNLSDCTFSYSDLDLLNKGINFIPSNSKIDTNKIDNSFFKFIRKIKLKDYFGDNKTEPVRFRPPPVLGNLKMPYYLNTQKNYLSNYTMCSME